MRENMGKPFKLNPPPRYDEDYMQAMDTLNSYEFWLKDNPMTVYDCLQCGERRAT